MPKDLLKRTRKARACLVGRLRLTQPLADCL